MFLQNMEYECMVYMSSLIIGGLPPFPSWVNLPKTKQSRRKTSSTFGHPIAERCPDADVDCGAEG